MISERVFLNAIPSPELKGKSDLTLTRVRNSRSRSSYWVPMLGDCVPARFQYEVAVEPAARRGSGGVMYLAYLDQVCRDFSIIHTYMHTYKQQRFRTIFRTGTLPVDPGVVRFLLCAASWSSVMYRVSIDVASSPRIIACG